MKNSRFLSRRERARERERERERETRARARARERASVPFASSACAPDALCCRKPGLRRRKTRNNAKRYGFVRTKAWTKAPALFRLSPCPHGTDAKIDGRVVFSIRETYKLHRERLIAIQVCVCASMRVVCGDSLVVCCTHVQCVRGMGGE